MLQSVGSTMSTAIVKLMRLSGSAVLMTLFATFALSLPAWADDMPTAENKFGKPNITPIEFAGTIVDADNKPIANAIVHLKAVYADIDVTLVTDEHGQFKTQLRLQTNAVSNMELSANSADGKLIGNHHWQETNNELAFNNLTITIQPPRTATVKVIDASGSAIAGASVAMQFNYPHSSNLQTTDTYGVATISMPQSERINAVVAWKDGAGLDYRSYELSRNNGNAQAKAPEFPADGVQELKLEGVSPLRVDVTDDQARPLANAETYIWLLRQEGQEQLNLSYLSKFFKKPTDDQGQVTFDWLPIWQKDTTIVWASVPGYTRPRGEYEPLSKSGHLAIELQRMIPIRGKLMLPDGKPAAGIAVAASGAGYTKDNFRGTAISDETGAYELSVDPNQIYMLWIQDKKWAAPAQSGFAVLSNQSVPDHDFQLAPAVRIHGQLLEEPTNSPMPNKYIGLSQYGVDSNTLGHDIVPHPKMSRKLLRPTQQTAVMTDDHGAFEFFVGPGQYTLFAGIRGTKAQQFEITTEVDKHINLYMQVQPMIQISGSVVDDKTDQPVANAKIEAISISKEDFKEWNTSTDAAGQFATQRLVEPAVIRAISPERQSGAIAEITADAPSVQLRLKPLGSVTARLMNEDGSAPASNVKLHYGVRISEKETGMSSDRFGAMIITDESGRFSMENLVPNYEYICTFYDHPSGFLLNATTVKVEPGQKLDLGDLRSPEPPKPYVPETLEQRIEGAFNVAGTPQERYDKAKKLIAMVNQNLVILFGNPTDARVHELMKIRFEDESFRPYSDDFRIMAIPTDKDRLKAAKELAATFNVDLADGREAFHMLILNHAGELVASAGVKQLCDEDKLSKTKLFAMLDPHRTQPLDAQVLLDNALKQAAQENKRVLVQETATWCGPCHMLSRLLMGNRQWEQDYVWVKMDHRWTGAIDIMKKMRGDADGGIPWFVILDASGKQLATSNVPDTGENIGFPSEESGQTHFANMLKATRQRMTDADIEQLVAAAKNQE